MTNLVGNQVIVTGADIFDQANNYRHGLRWSVTLTPTSLQGCLAELAHLVTQLRESGVFNAGEATSLLGKVDAASRQASQGKTTPAKNLLNALINAVGGATWVSFHHGGGVGIGYSQHAGQVIVADGTPEAAQRLERVLTTDPGMGVVRHADAGYPEAIKFAKENGIKIPMMK